MGGPDGKAQRGNYGQHEEPTRSQAERQPLGGLSNHLKFGVDDLALIHRPPLPHSDASSDMETP